MATHSSILAGIIPCIEEPGKLQSIASQRVAYGRAIEQACMHDPRNPHRHSSEEITEHYRKGKERIILPFIDVALLLDSGISG